MLRLSSHNFAADRGAETSETSSTGDSDRPFSEEYHRQAKALAIERGYDAYFSDLYQADDADLVIVRPDVARIYRQDVSYGEWMDEGPRADFCDIPERADVSQTRELTYG